MRKHQPYPPRSLVKSSSGRSGSTRQSEDCSGVSRISISCATTTPTTRDTLGYWQQHVAPFLRAKFGRTERGASLVEYALLVALIAGLLMGGRAAFVTAVATMAALLIMLIAESTGTMPKPIAITTPLTLYINISLFLLLVAPAPGAPTPRNPPHPAVHRHRAWWASQSRARHSSNRPWPRRATA